MELYQIKSFIAVADALNLTRAARETHQSPSAVSSQIKALETDLGVILFKRSPKGMSLTPDGETLLTSARVSFHSKFHRPGYGSSCPHPWGLNLKKPPWPSL